MRGSDDSWHVTYIGLRDANGSNEIKNTTCVGVFHPLLRRKCLNIHL